MASDPKTPPELPEGMVDVSADLLEDDPPPSSPIVAALPAGDDSEQSSD